MNPLMRAYVRIRPRNIERLLEADLRRPPLGPLELGFTAAAAVPAYKHNTVIEAGMRRAEKLEGRLAALIDPILRGAGERAAAAFQARATNHLTAAVPGVTSNSTMVCLKPRPEEAAAVADPNGDAADTLHVTLAYLGEIDGPLEHVLEALRPVAGAHAPLAGAVGGYGMFTAGDEKWPAILLPDVPGLVELRVAVTEALSAAGISYGRDHGFTAHITLAYQDVAAPGEPGEDPGTFRPDQAGAPLHFDDLYVVRGDVEVHPVPLAGVPPVTAAAPPGPPSWSPPAGDEVLDVDALVSQLRGKTDPVRQELIRTVMTPALAEAGLAYDVSNPLVSKLLAQSGSQITHIAATTQLNVMRVIRKSHEEGLTIPDTAKAIRAGMSAASPARATLIARTELVGAVNGGSLAATQLVQQATGLVYRKEWLTAEGAEHPRHEEYDGLNGQTVALDDLFDVGGTMLEFPGDPGGPPEEICNCRCTLVYTEGGDGTEAANAGDTSGGGTSSGGGLAGYLPLGGDSVPAAAELGTQLEALSQDVLARDTARPVGTPDVARVADRHAALIPKAQVALQQMQERGWLANANKVEVIGSFNSAIDVPHDLDLLVSVDKLTAEQERHMKAISGLLEGGPSRLDTHPFGDDVHTLFTAPASEWDAKFADRYRKATVKKYDAPPGVLWDATAEPPALAAVSSDPYVASLQAELKSLDNKIGNVQWYIKNGKEQPHHQGRLEALVLRQDAVRELLANPLSVRDELEAIQQKLPILRRLLVDNPDQAARFKESIKLYEQRQKVLEEMSALPPVPNPDLPSTLFEPPAPVVAPSALPGNLVADLEAIEKQAEWITPQEARDLATQRTASGWDDRYFPSPAAVQASGPLAGYLKEQLHAVLAAGGRIEQEMAIPASLDADIARAAEYVGRVEADSKAAIDPFYQAWDAASSKVADGLPAARERLAQKLYGKKFEDLDFTERNGVTSSFESDAEWSKLRAASHAANDRLIAERAAWYDRERQAKQAEKAAKEAKAVAVRDAALRVLSEIRPLGAKPGKTVGLVGKARGFKKAGALLEKGQQFYPTAWIGRWRAIEPGTAARGYHRANYTGAEIKVSMSDRSAITSDPAGLPTAIHELGHEVEATNGVVLGLERAFYEYRTRGGTFTGAQDPLERMSKLKPGHGYGAQEVGREDQFSEPYMGKEYPRGYAYELLTMGMEALFTGSQVLDAEYMRWLLGVLALA